MTMVIIHDSWSWRVLVTLLLWLADKLQSPSISLRTVGLSRRQFFFFSSKTLWKAGPRRSACWPETMAVLLGLIIACYRIKCFPLILLIGTIEIRERLYVTWAHAGNWSSKWMISEIWLRFDNLGTENRDFTRKKCISRVDCCFHQIGPKHPTLPAHDTVKKEGPYVPEPNYN